jgi:hypothetical protein
MDHTYKIVKKTIEWKTADIFKLSFFGDVHYDAESCDRDRFAKFLRQAREENSHVFGMGDYFDFASAREQKALHTAGLHETTIEGFDGIVQSRNREMVAKLKDINILGLVGGNHTWKLANGYYADEDLADRLKTEYLGWLCVYCITFRFTGNKSVSLYFVLCHGTGGGKLPGTSINKIDDLKRIFPFADIYAMGHDHQRGCWPTSTLWPHNDGPGTLKIKEKRQYPIRTGSFMKSYQDNSSQYTTSGLMRPADLGGVRLNIKFTTKRNTSAIGMDIESIV